MSKPSPAISSGIAWIGFSWVKRMSCIVDAFREKQQIHPLQTEAPSVHLLQPQEEKKWDKFVSACPEATFFHRAGWQAVIQRAFGHKTWFLYA